MDLASLPQFMPLQTVRAVQIGDVLPPDGLNLHWRLRPVDPAIDVFSVDPEWVQLFSPAAGGYFVIHPDGHRSFCSAAKFAADFAPQ